MSVCVDQYMTTAFRLKDARSEAYIRALVDLLSDDANLAGGYRFNDATDALVEGEDGVLYYRGTGFADATAALKPSVAERARRAAFGEPAPEEDDEDVSDDGDEVNLFHEIQAHLAPGWWFFVDQHTWEKIWWSSAVHFYHADGRSKYVSSHDVKSDLTRTFGLTDPAKSAPPAPAAATPQATKKKPKNESPNAAPQATKKKNARPNAAPSTAKGAVALTRETHTVNGQTFELVRCPPGTFTMGSPADEEHRSDDEVQHEVTLTRGFAMGVVPVTQALWEAATGENPSRFTDGEEAPQRPVEVVSWFEAVRFCNALSAQLGLEPAYTIGEGDAPAVTCDVGASGFRLPTEAEWEYAARSGSDSFVYAGSDELDEVGWYRENSAKTTQPVAGKRPTRWGLYDVSGNVWEWCWDVFGAYSEGQTTDPCGAESGARRVVRGGGWVSGPRQARVAYRNSIDPADRKAYVGLRLSRTVP